MINLKKISACGCSTYGSSSISCNKSGECTCVPNVVGTKCTECKLGFFGFPNCQGKKFKYFNNMILKESIGYI